MQPRLQTDLFSHRREHPSAYGTNILSAAETLARAIVVGTRIGNRELTEVMTAAFGASEAEGGWRFKDAYDAVETAQVLILRRHWRSIVGEGDPMATAKGIAAMMACIPTETRRSEESAALQQFSTPAHYAFFAALAADMGANDVVLEPSAGTGMLAVHAELAGARLALNELSGRRRHILAGLFPEVPLTAHDAERVHDLLDAGVVPTVVLMNPPFTASPHAQGIRLPAAAHHLRSTLLRLAEGGRMVAITNASFGPHDHRWTTFFAELQERATLRFSCGLVGKVYAKHGTTIETRLHVFDKVPADVPSRFENVHGTFERLGHVLPLIDDLPPRQPATCRLEFTPVPEIQRKEPRKPEHLSVPRLDRCDEIAIESVPWQAEPCAITDALYEEYTPQRLHVPGAVRHPTPLVQSAAMASVAPPAPAYRPRLPNNLINDGVLSEAQIEAIVYAGQAHAADLPGSFTVEDDGTVLAPASDDDPAAFRVRQGFMIGDGTGVGKGREAAGIILDNRMQGRRRAVWVSERDKLIEDARRDWRDLDGDPRQLTSLHKVKVADPIPLEDGILFATYSLLRTPARQGRRGRLEQLVEWLGRDFDGVVILDEAHNLGGAMARKGKRGTQQASQQGRAGIRLQNLIPRARVVYVSATGATEIHNLAYAARLGLWGPGRAFAGRDEFVARIEKGGVAALEVVARDLKELGLYIARSLSFHGVEYETLVHELTPPQVELYDTAAEAFRIVMNNIDKALQETGAIGLGNDGEPRTLNRQAKSAALSAFWGTHQRFAKQVLTAMKMPTLLGLMERDLEDGMSPVVQITHTNEAAQERALAEADPEDLKQGVTVDITPRATLLQFLEQSFPTTLMEPYADEDGNLFARPVADGNGNPVRCREAVARRDRLMARIAAMPCVEGPLEQLLDHFGPDRVAEITGRKRRVVWKEVDGHKRRLPENRPASANLTEAQAFMDADKPILVFSQAGGTGRSYHADLRAANTRRRVHYFLDPGWEANKAMQGLGRTHRTHQASAPLVRVIATDVHGEQRFLSAIARRMASLGALTRGQRQTGGNGMFDEEDNLESVYAREALRTLYRDAHAGEVPGIGLALFEDRMGLRLSHADSGDLLEDLPPVTQFLNRLLALRIEDQNALFAAFAERIRARIDAAKEAGTYQVGVETLRAESFTVTGRTPVYRHDSGAETTYVELLRRDRFEPYAFATALELTERHRDTARFAINTRSGRAALVLKDASRTLADGSIQERVRLMRPAKWEYLAQDAIGKTHWRPATREEAEPLWNAEVARAPEWRETRIHMITGTLLPIWDRLPLDEHVRVYRLQIDGGERMLGRVIHADQVPETLRKLGAGDDGALDAARVIEAVMARGSVVRLANGWEFRRRRYNGRPRVELSGPAYPDHPALSVAGIQMEIVQYRMRYFVPESTGGETAVQAILYGKPVAEVLAGEAA